MTNENIKKEIYQKCIEWIDNKINILKKAVNDAQESANAEEKSSAGDKYETGRAMSQNERDMFAKQLAEYIKQKQFLLSIDVSKFFKVVSVGSLVKTSSENYFIGISIGKVIIQSINYYVISPDTPISKLILNKKVGEEYIFNGKKSRIEEIL